MSFVKKIKATVRTKLLMKEWRDVARSVQANALTDLKSVVFIPADQIDVSGSKGDEAMIIAISSMLKKEHGIDKFGIVTDRVEIGPHLHALGFCQHKNWVNQSWRLAEIAQIIDQYDAVVVVGADVMDGYYAAPSSLRRWMVADIAARKGKKSVVTGFSFNAKPSTAVTAAINKLVLNVSILSRDPISFQRIRKVRSDLPQLVADCAFMLQPSSISSVVAQAKLWTEARKQAGDAVLGLNLHPLLFKAISSEQLQQLNTVAIAAVEQLLASSATSVLLIPHDFRGPGVRDDDVLLPMYQALREKFGDRVMLWTDELLASDIKQLAGFCDVVVSGRMHLAIGALGMGVPVAGLTYQGKFEGLFDHFGLSHDLLLAPDQLVQGDAFYRLLQKSVAEADTNRAIVAKALPGVKALSRKNIDAIVA